MWELNEAEERDGEQGKQTKMVEMQVDMWSEEPSKKIKKE